MGRILMSLLLFGVLSVHAAAVPCPIPCKQDPPIQVDGDISDWKDVPVFYHLDSADQILYRRANMPGWRNGADFSGRVSLCWKPDGLYVCAEVKDDSFYQARGGKDVFCGDHVEIFLDTMPRADTGSSFGKGQYQLLISPGNFANLPAEIFCSFPKNHSMNGVICASERKADGWTIEAYIPWILLGLPKQLHENHRLNFEIWLSDTDADYENMQKTIMTAGDVKWKFRTRAGMKAGVLADANSRYNPEVFAQLKPVNLPALVSIPKAESRNLEFVLPETPHGLAPILQFQARLVSKSSYGGYTQPLKLQLNGVEITGKHLIGRPLEIENVKGHRYSFYSKDGFTVPYTNNWNTCNRTTFIWKKNVRMLDYEFNLATLARKGRNVLKISNAIQNVKNELQVKDGKIIYKVPPVIRTARPAPTGKIPVIEPSRNFRIPYFLRSQGNPLKVELNKAAWTVSSRFSTPDGKWTTGSNSWFSHKRVVEQKDEVIVVKDVFENLTGELLPIMQRHEVSIPGKKKVFHICGLEAVPSNSRSSSFNSSSFGADENGGIGLYPLNKEFHLHAENYIRGKDTIGLCDDMLVLPPKGKITQQFALVLSASGSYWDFVNPLRRFLGANFTLNLPMGVFDLYSENVFDRFWGDGTPLQNRAEKRGNRLLFLNHHIGFDADFRDKKFDRHYDWYREAIVRLKKLLPGRDMIYYMHNQICSNKDAHERFAGCEVRYKNGKNAFYGRPENGLFLAIEGNAYAAMYEKKLDFMMDSLDIQGFFWDEMACSGYPWHYGEPWDQCSGDISPVTHKLERLKSSVTLLQMPWQKRMLKKIYGRGKRVVANGRIYGELKDFKVPVVTETAQISLCAREQLWTPVQYAKYINLPRPTTSGYYRDMLDGLDYGCVFTGRSLLKPWTKNSSRPDLTAEEFPTLDQHMYPITPMELHKGYIIGRERIITKNSGLFGWGDDSQHEVHVYGATGHELRNFKAPLRKLNGRTYTELRLPEFYSAVVIRMKKQL